MAKPVAVAGDRRNLATQQRFSAPVRASRRPHQGVCLERMNQIEEPDDQGQPMTVQAGSLT